MFDETKGLPPAHDLVQPPALHTEHTEFQAESASILKPNRLESEKITCQVGFERALADWIIRHRSKWHKARQPEAQPSRI